MPILALVNPASGTAEKAKAALDEAGAFEVRVVGVTPESGIA